MNKDIEVLSNVTAYMQDARICEDKAQFEREQLTSITSHLSFAGGGGNKVRQMDDTFAKISELEMSHVEKLKMYAREIRKAESIVNAIPIERMQTFVMLRYVLNRSKHDIMECMCMTEREYRWAREAIEKAESMADVNWYARAMLPQKSEADA